MQNRNVAIVDIPGAFMQADIDEIVHVRFTDKMVDLLVDVDESYREYVHYENGNKVLYVELLKALYGTLRAARLFWEKLSSQLKSWGFISNPYDCCVMNKIVDGKQCTVAWHVDDLKISHESNHVVDDIIEKLQSSFGHQTPLTIQRGKILDYLGMTLDFIQDGEVIFDMIDYVKNIISNAPEEMKGVAKTPATMNLFKVNKQAARLNRQDSSTFHRIVMQLLYLSQRARPDIRTAVSFLCKRTTKADTDDWKKLVRVMCYLNDTMDLKLRLRPNSTGEVRWWIDAAYGIHHDMKGHTGGTMSMGEGSIYSSSSSQKINTRSSTECEVVGVHDMLPQALWTKSFWSHRD
jgi:hypothetical protein